MKFLRCLQGADYTALGSFGDAQQFGENLVASLDRSFLLRSGFNRPKSVQVGDTGLYSECLFETMAFC